ncbi:MAG TPA: helix-turn-helix domain-containing protein [Rhodothermales bacterium]|nr:helix-turn-helix domain-containing protein [Rhodothermales bacterium]
MKKAPRQPTLRSQKKAPRQPTLRSQRPAPAPAPLDAETLPAGQRRVLETLVQLRRQSGGVTPSMREIAAALGLKSPHGIKSHLDALERKGFLRRRPHLARYIELLWAAPDAPTLSDEEIPW